VPPDLDGTVELVALDAVGEELDHLGAPHLAVDDDIEAGTFVLVGDDPCGVVFRLLPVLLVEVGVVVLVELLRAVEPLGLR